MLTAAHFAEYTEELREFSASHGVRCGAAEDLQGLVKALEGFEAFSVECACMLRSVVYRERGQADAVSLLMLVTHAWGGLTEPEEGTALEGPVLSLWEYVRGAMRAPQLEEVELCGEEVPATVVRSALVERRVAAEPQTLFEVESAMRELEARSPEVRRYCELLQQRDAELGRFGTGEAAVPGRGEAEGGSLVETVGATSVREDDPWDENSELQQELRRFAQHRERMQAREAERAMRPLHAKLLGEAESALVHLLGRENPLRRAFGLRSH